MVAVHQSRVDLPFSDSLLDEGFLRLPSLRNSGKRGPRIPVLSHISDPPPPIHSLIADLEPLQLRLIDVTISTMRIICVMIGSIPFWNPDPIDQSPLRPYPRSLVRVSVGHRATAKLSSLVRQFLLSLVILSRQQILAH